MNVSKQEEGCIALIKRVCKAIFSVVIYSVWRKSSFLSILQRRLVSKKSCRVAGKHVYTKWRVTILTCQIPHNIVLHVHRKKELVKLTNT